MTRYRVTYTDSVLRVALIDAYSPEHAEQITQAQMENAEHHHALDTWNDDWQVERLRQAHPRCCFECGQSVAA